MTSPSAESAAPALAGQGESPEIPTVLAGAVDQARAAVVEASGADAVGDYLGVDYEDPVAVTHRFAAELIGYRGWQWAVVVAAHPGADHATISEVVLIPGPTALLAPEWVPWDQRIRPGDLSPGDLLAPPVGDVRLVPGYTASGDPQVDDVAAEIGLGRRWVMSIEGRAEAAERWHEGDYGPGSAMARSTKRVCRDCGFFLPLAGVLGTMFGVCGNKMSADGHVVDSRYGCGAHSDTPAPPGSGSPAYEPYDDGVLDIVEPAEPADAGAQPEAQAEADAAADTEAEAEPEVRAEAEPEAPAEAEPEAPAEAEPEARAEAESEEG